MKTFFAAFLVITAASFAGRAHPRVTEVDLTVNEIRSGSTMGQVRRLGKPSRTEYLGLNECADQYERRMHYRGLKIGVLGVRSGRTGEVYSLVVTSANWTIAPGIKIGTNKRTILQKFGKPFANESGTLRYVTKGNLGWVGFTFRENKLIRAEMQETLC